MFRTDSHNNPTAFTTDIAKEAGLVLGVDYEQGDPFKAGALILYTAKLLKDPISVTIQVIDKIGFFNKANQQRWIYIGLPYKLWLSLNVQIKIWVLGYMYQHEGGTEFTELFSKFPAPISIPLANTGVK
jgi:hypothetical protein